MSARRPMFRTLTVALCLAGFALALVLRPTDAAAGAKTGLNLCAEVVLPSLFPFFVLSALVTELGLGGALGRWCGPAMRALFGVSGGGAAPLLLGLIGGYPLGARTVAQLCEQGQLSRQDGERLLLFCNNGGPAFILSVAGASVLGSVRAGWLLLGVHIVSALCCGLLARWLRPGGEPAGGGPDVPSAGRSVRFSQAFTNAIGSAVQSSLNVCACVVLFAVILRLARLFGLLQPGIRLLEGLGVDAACAEALLSGLVELTNGVALLEGASVYYAAPVAAFLLGFGGLSIFCQTASMLAASGLSPLWCLKGQLLHGCISFVLAAAAVQLFPWAVSTMTSAAAVTGGYSANLLPPLLGLGAWCGILGIAVLFRKRGSFFRKKAV
ncbi:MAG: sporulation protein [Clostridiales bacterium]|nr:sporulation protein [Clostridiales bacterium]